MPSPAKKDKVTIIVAQYQFCYQAFLYGKKQVVYASPTFAPLTVWTDNVLNIEGRA